jgi:tetratricopeptide (TPR) repeat protein
MILKSEALDLLAFKAAIGLALESKGLSDEAIAEYRYVARHSARNPWPVTRIGKVLAEKGLFDEGIAECRRGFQVGGPSRGRHFRLGDALEKKGLLDEAIAQFREALRWRNDVSTEHRKLADALARKGCLDEAITEYREAMRLNKYPLLIFASDRQAGSHRNLGNALRRTGRLEAAIAEYREASRCYAEAFAERPNLAENLASRDRYAGACSAVLAGCGLGTQTGGLPATERWRLRTQALTWLRAELKAWRQLLAKEPGKPAPTGSLPVQHWLRDPDLDGVRDPHMLREEERADWQSFWHDVQITSQGVAELPKSQTR